VRYDEENVVSHDKNAIRSSPVSASTSILLLADHCEVVGIDEAQFFDDELPSVCSQLADQGIRVIVAGLDMDFKGIPFGPIPKLLAMAEYVTKVHAICVRCGNLAQYSHRTTAEESLILLGETDNYEPICRKCYVKATKK
jgi:thymidine kinase